MKEIIRQSLTGRSPSHTLRGGDISMAEGRENMNTQGSKPPISQGNPERPGVPPSGSPRVREASERIAAAAQRGEEARRRGAPQAGAGSAGEQPPGDRPPAPPAGQPEEQPRERRKGPRIDMTGITDPRLLNEARVVQNVLGAVPIIELGDRLVNALERITLLEDVSPEQKDMLVQRIQEAVRDTNQAIRALGRRPEGLYGERKLTEDEKTLIKEARTPEEIEELFNRMFDRVDSRPQVDFDSAFGNAGTFEYEEFMKILNEEISAKNKEGNFDISRELSKIRDKFSNERSARAIIHNAFFAVISGQNTEAVANYIASFLSGYADLAFSKDGVVAAMHFYEEALLMVREKNGGFLKPKDVIGHIKENERGEVNMLSEDLLKQANEQGKLALDREGLPRKLAKWELDRALSFARGMSIIIGNSIEIAASSIIPGVEYGGSAFNDLFAQRIIGEIYPFRHTAKFWTGSKFSKPLAYFLHRDRTPWTPRELEEFKKMDLSDQIKVLNDLVPEGKERFYSILNPLEIGGLFSKTGWRIGGDPRYPGQTAISKMMRDPQERDWIGTGVIIERGRGNLENLNSKDKIKKEKAEKSLGEIISALKRTSRVTPLKLFLNIRELKERVLADLFESDYFTSEEKDAIRKIVADEKKSRELSEVDKDKDNKPNQKDIEIIQSLKFGAIMDSDKFKGDFNNLVLLQEQALSTKDLQAVGNQSRLARVIKDTFLDGRREEGKETYMEAFLERLHHKGWKIPFVFGTEDIPFNKYTLEDTGARSVARRWADMQSAAKAGNAFIEFLIGIEHYTKQEQVVEAMHKVYQGIFGYSEDFAQKFTKQLAEGVMKFYGKSWAHRLPLGLGTLHTLATGRASFAQMAYGRDAMAWDELDLNQFTRLLRSRGLLSVEGQHELQKRAGGGKKEATWDVARTVLPLLMIAMAYYVLTEASKEKL